MVVAIQLILIINLIFLLMLLPSIHCNNNHNTNVIKKISIKSLDYKRTKVWGPGLRPDEIVTPVRYFFIQSVDRHGKDFNTSLVHTFDIQIINRLTKNSCLFHIEQIDRGDGSYIIRYKVYRLCENVDIIIQYNDEHIADSPYSIKGTVYSEKCSCPETNINKWFQQNECQQNYEQIINDLIPFKNINFTIMRSKIIEKFNHPGSISICNYVIKSNEIYRKCYGQYTGFKMFSDSLLLALSRRVKLPDIEFFMNLGDWPLMKKGGVTRTHGAFPIFSWCGSDDSFDIVLPTYDLTESTLETMNRVTLDILSVQKKNTPWMEKESKVFWRGRDSRRERLDLIKISKKYPKLFNASITNFFFFRDEENDYLPKSSHISFFEFFDSKYQLNIDGTVAAYRFPYLLGGDSVVFKQNSPFYEHFYKQLEPMKHFIPVKRDLSDLVNQIEWAIDNDDKAMKISREGRNFVNENLLPTHIFCYHLKLFEEWSKRITSDINVQTDMEKVTEINQDIECACDQKMKHFNDEL